MRSGEARFIFAKRNATLARAKSNNPERWGSRETKIWKSPEMVTLNPDGK